MPIGGRRLSSGIERSNCRSAALALPALFDMPPPADNLASITYRLRRRTFLMIL